MKLTLQTTMWGGAIFALACLAFALNGFMSLEGIADPRVLADAKGFAWFWMFLAAVCAAFAALAWWLVRTTPRDR